MVESSKDLNNKSEEELSIAVDNVCAILEDYDIEMIGNLLREHNWDESASISAYYAKKGQNQFVDYEDGEE